MVIGVFIFNCHARAKGFGEMGKKCRAGLVVFSPCWLFCLVYTYVCGISVARVCNFVEVIVCKRDRLAW